MVKFSQRQTLASGRRFKILIAVPISLSNLNDNVLASIRQTAGGFHRQPGHWKTNYGASPSFILATISKF